MVSLGDAGLKIELLTIQIPSHPHSIANYDTNLIPTTDSRPWSRFQYKFELPLIKVNLLSMWFWPFNKNWIFNDLLKDQNYQLKDRKCQNRSKSWYILTFLIYFKQFWYQIDHFRSKSKILMHFWADLIDFVVTG